EYCDYSSSSSSSSLYSHVQHMCLHFTSVHKMLILHPISSSYPVVQLSVMCCSTQHDCRRLSYDDQRISPLHFISAYVLLMCFNMLTFISNSVARPKLHLLPLSSRARVSSFC